jgi:hypothetical protein
MNEPPRHFYVTVTMDREEGPIPGPAEFAVAAQRAAALRTASVMTAHTARPVISVVSVHAADRPAAVGIALAVVSEALRRPAVSPTR